MSLVASFVASTMLVDMLPRGLLSGPAERSLDPVSVEPRGRAVTGVGSTKATGVLSSTADDATADLASGGSTGSVIIGASWTGGTVRPSDTDSDRVSDDMSGVAGEA